MTRKSVDGAVYPKDWKEISARVRESVGWKCVRCAHRHDPETGYTLTVHHANMDPSCSEWWNLLPLCQRCHLAIQAKVDLNRPWVMADHSEWFKPYVAGFYAHKYLGLSLSRDEVMSRLDELLSAERRIVLGVAA